MYFLKLAKLEINWNWARNFPRLTSFLFLEKYFASFWRGKASVYLPNYAHQELTQWWKCTPLILALRGKRHMDLCEFKSQPAIQSKFRDRFQSSIENPVSKNQPLSPLQKALIAAHLAKMCPLMIQWHSCSGGNKLLSHWISPALQEEIPSVYCNSIIHDYRVEKILVKLPGTWNKCGVISSRFDVKLKNLENWQNNLFPNLWVWLHCTDKLSC